MDTFVGILSVCPASGEAKSHHQHYVNSGARSEQLSQHVGEDTACCFATFLKRNPYFRFCRCPGTFKLLNRRSHTLVRRVTTKLSGGGSSTTFGPPWPDSNLHFTPPFQGPSKKILLFLSNDSACSSNSAQ